MNDDRQQAWYRATKGNVNKRVLEHVRSIEQRQWETFNRFLMLEALYDPRGAAAELVDAAWKKKIEAMKENAIASAVDTVCAGVATAQVRPRFMTDGASWSVQRRARNLGRYAEEGAKRFKVHDRCRKAFFGAIKKGTGCVKVYADQDGQPRIEHIMIDNVIVDDAQCLNGAAPREMHYRLTDVDRDELIQQFPDFEDEIDQAQAGDGSYFSRSHLLGSLVSAGRNDLTVVESWRLPLGVRGRRGYVAGRHTICIAGVDLVDEKYHKPHFPIAVMRCAERESSFYGISMIERVEGHQRTLNRRGRQADKILDNIAYPTMFVRHQDAALQVKTHEFGNVCAVKGDYPVWLPPPGVNPDLTADRQYHKQGVYDEAGVSRMAATASKPAGLDSGAALREYRDAASARFALQELAFEQLVLDVIMLLLDVCKDLGKAAPKMSRQTRFGVVEIDWPNVDMGDVEVMIAAASTLSRTPAGRMQTILEFAQAGIFSLDDVRRMVDHPDAEQTLSLYNAQLEAIEANLEHIEDGHTVVPEPYENLSMALARSTNRYLVDREAAAPEDVLEELRSYINNAAWLLGRGLKGGPPDPLAPMGGPTTSATPLAPGGPPPITPQQVPNAGAPLTTPPQTAT